MKRIIISLCLVTLVSAVYAAETATVTVPTTVITNLLSVAGSGSAKITAVLITSPADNAASIKLVDTSSTNLYWTNAAYYTYTKYATNMLTWWTNFFGISNGFYSVQMAVKTNTVAGSTNWFTTIPFVVGTNETTLFGGLSYVFRNGLYVTNTGTGNATVTVTYEQ